jgi:hypothetical protein
MFIKSLQWWKNVHVTLTIALSSEFYKTALCGGRKKVVEEKIY